MGKTGWVEALLAEADAIAGVRDDEVLGRGLLVSPCPAKAGGVEIGSSLLSKRSLLTSCG